MLFTTSQVVSSSFLVPLLFPSLEVIILSMSFSRRRLAFVDVSAVSHLEPCGLESSLEIHIEPDALPSGTGYPKHVHRVHLLSCILHDCWSGFPHRRPVNDGIDPLLRQEDQCNPPCVTLITYCRSELCHLMMRQPFLPMAAVRPDILPFLLFVHEEHVHFFPYLSLQIRQYVTSPITAIRCWFVTMNG